MRGSPTLWTGAGGARLLSARPRQGAASHRRCPRVTGGRATCPNALRLPCLQPGASRCIPWRRAWERAGGRGASPQGHALWRGLGGPSFFPGLSSLGAWQVLGRRRAQARYPQPWESAGRRVRSCTTRAGMGGPGRARGPSVGSGKSPSRPWGAQHAVPVAARLPDAWGLLRPARGRSGPQRGRRAACPPSALGGARPSGVGGGHKRAWCPSARLAPCRALWSAAPTAAEEARRASRLAAALCGAMAFGSGGALERA